MNNLAQQCNSNWIEELRACISWLQGDYQTMTVSDSD